MSDTRATWGAAERLYEALRVIAERTDKEIPITQVMALLRVAAAGDGGTDQGALGPALLDSAPGHVSRTIQSLSAVRYDRKPGYDLVRADFGKFDRRSRTVTLTRKGEELVEKVVKVLNKGR